MDTRVWSPPTFLKKCLMTWRFTSPTPRAVTPRTTRPGQRAKGYILFHTSPLSSIRSFFNLLPAPLFFSSSPSVFVLCDSRLLFWWIIEGKQKTKEKWRQLKHRDIPLNTRLRNLYFYVRCSAEAIEEKCELLMKLHIHKALFEKKEFTQRDVPDY